MSNNEEQLYKLEKQYQESLDAQKRFYESEIGLLNSKHEYEKEKIRVDIVFLIYIIALRYCS